MVHDFATKYFNLPKDHKKVIADAVSYASEVAKSDEKYDYVVHDVFTGGAEPVDLFTQEFLQDLNSILKPGGVIAIVSFTFLHPGSNMRKANSPSSELRRRPPLTLRPYNSLHHPIRFPQLSHLPRKRSAQRRATGIRRPRFHQHGNFLHQCRVLRLLQASSRAGFPG